MMVAISFALATPLDYSPLNSPCFTTCILLSSRFNLIAVNSYVELRYKVEFADMSSVLTPSKRTHSPNPKLSNGRKFQKLKRGLKSSTGNAELRVLCPNSKAEYLMGNDGSIVSQICQETGASIIVHEPVSECDDRVISISMSEVANGNAKEEKKADEELSNAAELPNDDQSHEEYDGDDDGSPQGDFLDLKDRLLAVQNGLLLLFEKMGDEEQNMENENNVENDEPSNSSLRFLVLSSQVDCILGEGGSMAKQVTDESGAHVQVLPRDKLPTCVSSSDVVVEITGMLGAVKKAIKLVSEKLLENADRDDDPSGPKIHSTDHPTPKFDAHSSKKFSSQGSSFRTGYRDGHDRRNLPFKLRQTFLPNRANTPSQILSLRLLCPVDRIGGLIGKGGAIIKSMKQETGCEINVAEATLDAEDRIIIMSGPAHPEERISPVQDAVLRVLARISKVESDKKEKVVAKLLVPSNQIGCLLGKGGSIISEMRKSTGAYIRIQGKDQTPKPTTHNAEVVLINGDFEAVQEALVQVTSKLRHHFFRDVYPSLNLPWDPPSLDSSFIGRREQPPPQGGFPNMGLPPFRHFDSIGGPPIRPGFLHHDDGPPFMHDIHGPGAPHIPERPWDPQVMMEGGPMGPVDFGGGPPRRMGGYPGGGRFITNTEFKVVVPTSVIPSIYGEGGGCLRQIRQISDAKITITDPKPGAAETIIIISGTPEQTHAAQSLIQAFVMCETESS